MLKDESKMPKWFYYVLMVLAVFVFLGTISKCSYELGTSQRPNCVFRVKTPHIDIASNSWGNSWGIPIISK